MKPALLNSLVALSFAGPFIAAEPAQPKPDVLFRSDVVPAEMVLAHAAGPHLEGIPLRGIMGFIVPRALGVAWPVIALESGRL